MHGHVYLRQSVGWFNRILTTSTRSWKYVADDDEVIIRNGLTVCTSHTYLCTVTEVLWTLEEESG